MQLTPEIHYHGLSQRPEVDDLIHRKIEHLERLNARLIGCRVTLDRPHRHARKGAGFRVQVDLTLPPRRELVVSEQDQPASEAHEDNLSLVVQRAFDKAERRLKRLTEENRGERKHHPNDEVNAYVDKLFRSYGFLRALDGRQIYFHRHSVSSEGFRSLRVGTGVHFAEEAGEKGPQASTVRVVQQVPSGVRGDH